MIAFIGTRLHFGLFLLAVGLGTLMAGCGFQLRGSYSLPYESIYVGGADYNLIVANMKRAIRNTGTRLADSKEDAQATFLPAGEKREAKILSLSSTGRVREKRLVYTYNYRVIDGKGRDLVLPGSVELTREITYADSDVLAKTQEEELLWRDMEGDLVQQLMRRLAAAKPTAPPGLLYLMAFPITLERIRFMYRGLAITRGGSKSVSPTAVNRMPLCAARGSILSRQSSSSSRRETDSRSNAASLDSSLLISSASPTRLSSSSVAARIFL